MSRRSAEFASWLFRPMAATPLAALRIAVGALALVSSVSLLPDVVPLLTWMRVPPEGDIGWWQPWSGAPAGAVVAIGVTTIVAAALLTVGLWSRAAAWTCFIATLALQRYNPAAFNGGDFIFRGVLLLSVALGPSGAYLSLDAWRRNRRWSWEAPSIPAWPIRFVQLHVSLGYILTVLLKLRGETWIDGTAMWYALGLEDLTRIDLPIWVLVPPVGALLAWGTLVVEASVGIGVWFRRSRPWVLAAGTLLHIGIAIVFEIALFQAVMIASFLAFLPAVDDVRLLRPENRRRRRVAPAIGA